MGCASAGIEPTDNGLRAFCRFCVDSGWMEGNPASALKTTRVSHCPTLPYSDEEVDRLLEAARTMQVFGRYGPRIESMILLLRYSGLRMQAAACKERLADDKLFLYQQKTGTPVYCPLPPEVVKEMTAVENDNERCFLYDGTSQRESMVKSWDRVSRRSVRPQPRQSRTAIHADSGIRSRFRCC